MIGCKIRKANFGSEFFCRICGMDIGLEFILKSKKGKTEIYCCENCAQKE
jgi:hypothetical protein